MALVSLYAAFLDFRDPHTQPLKKRLHKYNHAAIFLAIAGTATPFLLGSMRGPWAWSLFGTVWGLSLVGASCRLIGGELPRKISHYAYALLASPQFNLHLPFWIILPIGALAACVFGVLLGAPTLKLRGDYLAIVTLGFGEIVRIFFNNLSQPVNITNGPQGISRIDPFTLGSFNFNQSEVILGLNFSGPIKYYYLLLLVLIAVIIINLRLEDSRIGRAWQAIRAAPGKR